MSVARKQSSESLSRPHAEAAKVRAHLALLEAMAETHVAKIERLNVHAHELAQEIERTRSLVNQLEEPQA